MFNNTSGANNNSIFGVPASPFSSSQSVFVGQPTTPGFGIASPFCQPPAMPNVFAQAFAQHQQQHQQQQQPPIAASFFGTAQQLFGGFAAQQQQHQQQSVPFSFGFAPHAQQPQQQQQHFGQQPPSGAPIRALIFCTSQQPANLTTCFSQPPANAQSAGDFDTSSSWSRHQSEKDNNGGWFGSNSTEKHQDHNVAKPTTKLSPGSTIVKYTPIDVTEKPLLENNTNGELNNKEANGKMHCITAMDAYETKSLEELRMEDIMLNNQKRKVRFGRSPLETPTTSHDGSNIFAQPKTSRTSCGGFVKPSRRRSLSRDQSMQEVPQMNSAAAVVAGNGPLGQNGLFAQMPVTPSSGGCLFDPTSTITTTAQPHGHPAFGQQTSTITGTWPPMMMAITPQFRTLIQGFATLAGNTVPQHTKSFVFEMYIMDGSGHL